MCNESFIAAPNVGLDSLVVTCWPAMTVLTSAVATPPDLPFALAARLLGEERIVPLLQRCFRARQRTSKQEEVLCWFWRQFQPLVRQEVGAFRRRAIFGMELDDLCQEAWLEMGNALPELRYDPGRGRLSGWVSVVTRRTVRRVGQRMLRFDTLHRQDIDEMSPPLIAADLEPEDECLLNELQTQIKAILCKLRRQTSPLSYEVFCKRFLEHQSTEEIAAELRLTPKAVRHRCERTMREFRALTTHEDVLQLADDAPL